MYEFFFKINIFKLFLFLFFLDFSYIVLLGFYSYFWIEKIIFLFLFSYAILIEFYKKIYIKNYNNFFTTNLDERKLNILRIFHNYNIISLLRF